MEKVVGMLQSHKLLLVIVVIHTWWRLITDDEFKRISREVKTKKT